MTLNSEKRKALRYDYSSPLIYSLGREVRFSHRAFAVNMSSSGLCLYLYEPVDVGMQIVIQNSIFPLPHKKATVRWIQEGAVAGIYKAGVEFSSPVADQ